MTEKTLVDANCGILSLASDGSVNWPRTLRLASFAHRDGISRSIVAVDYDCIDVLHGRLPHLRGLLEQHQIPITIAPAIEFNLSGDLFERVVHASLVFGGPVRRYVFLRLRRDGALPIAPVVHSLRRMNLTPILLAPERYQRFLDNDSELRKIVAMGGLLQVSAASLADQTDRNRIRFCRHLVRTGLCQLVASESGHHHDLPISLSDAYQVIHSWSGEERADALCCDNPGRVFEGEAIVSRSRPRRLLDIFTRRAA